FAAGRSESNDGEANELVELASASGLWDDSHIRQRVADCHSVEIVAAQLATRVAAGIRTGALPGPAGSLLKLFAADVHLQRSELAVELGLADAAAWVPG